MSAPGFTPSDTAALRWALDQTGRIRLDRGRGAYALRTLQRHLAAGDPIGPREMDALADLISSLTLAVEDAETSRDRLKRYLPYPGAHR